MVLTLPYVSSNVLALGLQPNGDGLTGFIQMAWMTVLKHNYQCITLFMNIFYVMGLACHCLILFAFGPLLTCKQIYFVHQSMERPGNLPH
jgi:hypothetical protein